MKVEIVEKRDNEVIVSFKGKSAMDAVMIGMVKMGPASDESILHSVSGGGYTKGRIIFGSWSIPVIEVMQAKAEEVK